MKLTGKHVATHKTMVGVHTDVPLVSHLAVLRHLRNAEVGCWLNLNLIRYTDVFVIVAVWIKFLNPFLHRWLVRLAKYTCFEIALWALRLLIIRH